MSVGTNPEKCCPPKEHYDAKRATIIRMRKHAKDIGEDRYVTNIKINAIRAHDMSKGDIVHCESDTHIYVFSIG